MVGTVIGAIAGLLGAICKSLIKEIYPLIPRLYELFEYISTYKILDSKFLNRIWNNIYIFVAVIVLFAIAVKLISSIVNPDTLSDNKKGVRAYYFRSVVAVVLIFIIPILFDYSFELQQDLVSNNFLTSRVFGFKIKDNARIGQILAWESFSSFCSPVSAEELNEDLNNALVLVQEDMNSWNIYYLFDKMNDTDKPAEDLDEKELKTAFRLYPILCFTAGALIAYELLLLCMDTLFRSAKLAFLEMMVPIVLGAYVFNPDILKKWAKEFFSTFISLFLKILALGFMILAFSQIKGVINQEAAFEDDQIMSGLFQAILVIGFLQLVKKIPDLINSIFGTNIKNAGGIKGRLGEMAGIGGLAQKAWTSLGNTAKNVGKLGLALPAGVLYKGADAIYHAKTGDRLKDADWFRKGKGALYGARAALKSGSWMDAIQAYDQQQALAALTPKDTRAMKDKMSKGFAQFNYGPNGYQSRVTNADGTQTWRSIAEQNANIDGVVDFTKKNMHGANSAALSTNLENQKVATKNSSTLSALKNTRENLSSNLSSYVTKTQNSTDYSPAVRNKMESIASNFADKGRLSQDDIQYMASHGIAGAEELKITTDLLAKYESGVREGNRIFGFDDNNNELRKVSTMGSYVSGAEATVKSLQEQAEELLNDSKTSNATKIAFKAGQTALTEMTKGYGNALQSGISHSDGTAVVYDDSNAWLQNEGSRNESYQSYVDEYITNAYEAAPREESTLVDANGNHLTIDNSPAHDVNDIEEHQPQQDNGQGAEEQNNINEIQRLNNVREQLLSQREEIAHQYPVDENAIGQIDAEIADIDRQISELS